VSIVVVAVYFTALVFAANIKWQT